MNLPIILKMFGLYKKAGPVNKKIKPQQPTELYNRLRLKAFTLTVNGVLVCPLRLATHTLH